MTLRLVYDAETERVLELVADLRERFRKLQSPHDTTLKLCPSVGYRTVPKELVGFSVESDPE